ncbi:MAG TPA: AAA family ATPase [Sandaracinaceae bacterium LLY-WYZ-13_1]|nr:AAA family ATPase [Sandaracinaceae bacterium LLY-WYZ-13_1]
MRARTNLSPPVSSFVGRRAELEALEARFETARLVTVLGPGGIGKTRLAMRFGEGRLEAYTAGDGGGVWFVDLAEARTPAGALAAVAEVLGADVAGRSSDAAVADAIGERVARLGRVLVVFDNFEHLVDGAARWVEGWVRGAPSARFVVTSRRVLGIDAEQVLALGPLDREDAAALFVGRARQVRLDAERPDPDVVGEIVDAIDRMPLAIELAASRTRILSAAELASRLERPLEILKSPGKDERHGSVRRAVLDSVALLSPAERRVFALASTMRNGFTVADAEAVLGERVLPRGEVLEVLEVLARTSLLRVEPGEPARHAYFETIRDVAEELAARDEARGAVLEAHSRHYARREPRAAVARDLENLSLAHRTAVRLARQERSADRAADAVAIARRLEGHLLARGLSRARRTLFDETLAALDAAGGADAAAEAWAHLGRGTARKELGETAPARADFEAALTLARETGRDGLAALALTHLGATDDVASDTGAARARFEQALALLERTPEDAVRTRREAEALLQLGHAHRREGDLDEARRRLGGASSRYRVLGDDEGLSAALYELAVLALFAGERGDALAQIDEGLAVARRGGVRAMEGTLTNARAIVLQEQGELAEALDQHARAARILGELGTRHREGSALFYLATAYVEANEPTDALAVLARARRRIAVVGAPRYEALIAACTASALAIVERFDDAAREVERAEAAARRVPNEPALEAAILAHRLAAEVRAGRRDGPGALAEAEAKVRASSNDDSRIALRILRAAVDGTARAGSEDVLEVWPDGRAFRAPRATEAVTLPERSPLRRLLDHFAQRRLEAPGEAVSIDEVIRAGWPDERIRADAALNRAYVAIASLRKKGLRDVLLTTGGGYALSAAVVVRRRAAG